MTEVELMSLLVRLADFGIKGIKVKYDGGGDSGAIEWIGITKEPCETPEDVCDRVNDWEIESNLANVDGGLYSEIENFADEILGDIEDWWNNEGGYGDLCICIPSGKYVINNHVRITDTEDFFHDGDLLSKVDED
jgi:hypothetical protein